MGSDRTYGARRVWHDGLELGHRCGLHRIERPIRTQALRARPRRRGLPKDHGQRSAIADNVLDRQFQADAPNQKWVADFTYIWSAEGWLYVAVVLDLYSRRVVGWSLQASMTSVCVQASRLELRHRDCKDRFHAITGGHDGKRQAHEATDVQRGVEGTGAGRMRSARHLGGEGGPGSRHQCQRRAPLAATGARRQASSTRDLKRFRPGVACIDTCA